MAAGLNQPGGSDNDSWGALNLSDERKETMKPRFFDALSCRSLIVCLTFGDLGGASFQRPLFFFVPHCCMLLLHVRHNSTGLARSRESVGNI